MYTYQPPPTADKTINHVDPKENPVILKRVISTSSPWWDARKKAR